MIPFFKLTTFLPFSIIKKFDFIVPLRVTSGLQSFFFPTLWCPAHHSVRLSGVLPTTESDLEVSCPPRSPTQQCPAHHEVRLSGVLPTTESDSVVSSPPRSPTWRCPVHHGVRLNGVLSTTESDSAVSSPPRSPTWR